MRLKLTIDLHDGSPVHEVWTNMECICEWEESRNRKVSDGKGIGYSDLVFWAHFLLRQAGEKMPATYKQWLKANPNMTIDGVDETDPNPTA